ncbi:hypothetical protein ACIBQ2_13685 [Micromonospora sediminimaris]|uniref:hypothetical protein n=1 Tax=Micromonospora sediminimaris TaxID=547162 RepID=UPI003791FC71
MTDPQSFTMQPYPLYYAQLNEGVILTGRVIGWHALSAAFLDAQPVVLFDEPDGSTGGLGYTEPEHVQLCWIRDSPTAALAAAERALGHERPMPGSSAKAALVGQLTTSDLNRVWGEVADHLAKTSKRVSVLVRDAKVTGFDGTTVTVAALSPVLAKMLNDSAGLLRDALYEQLGGRWEIRVEVRERKLVTECASCGDAPNTGYHCADCGRQG